MDGLYLIEVKARSGNVKSSKTVLENPNYKGKRFIKIYCSKFRPSRQ